jgi:hypothetical protein
VVAVAGALLGVAPAAGEPAEGMLPRVVFVARSDNPADALAVGPVAGVLGAPLMVTPADRLDGSAAAAIEAFAPDVVVVAGGTLAVSAAVEDAIKGLGFATRRVAGANRHETAALLAALLAEYGTGRPVLTGVAVTDEMIPALNAQYLQGLAPEDLMGVPGPAGPEGPAGLIRETDCGATGFVRAVDAEGMATCATDANTTYNAGAGLTLSRNAFAIATGGVTRVNLATNHVWLTGGNTATDPATQWLGTTDDTPFEICAGGQRALRIEPANSSYDPPNLVLGHPTNAVADGVYGATISGGGWISDAPWRNWVGGPFGTVAGGYFNSADAWTSTVSGGTHNIAGGSSSVVGGGGGNAASGTSSVVGGGSQNTASGASSTVPGGERNAATAVFSFAAGHRARAVHPGSFVWGDSTYANVSSTAQDQFIVRASGGVWLGTTSSPSIPAGRFLNTSTGGYLSTGGVWTNASDRDAKTGFEPVDGAEVLARLVRLPLSVWSYKAEDPAVRHLGPVAQDFHAAFGFGADDRSISTVDASGVALAAIQGLHELVEAQEARIAELEERLEQLEVLLAEPRE